MRLAGKTAVVTGGSSGLGRGMARLFCREGASVTVGDIDIEGGQETLRLVRAEGGNIRFHQADVSRWEEVGGLIEGAVAAFGRLDILVSNAGIGFSKPVEETTEADLDLVLGTNLKGVFAGCHYAVPVMKRQGGGAILNIASIHAFQGYKRHTAYAASKGGIVSLTKELAIELAPFFIRANAISPGYIAVTDYSAYWRGRVPEALWEEFEARFGSHVEDDVKYFQPLHMVARPEDVAHAAVYLVSDEARFVTGSHMIIDGGATVRMPKDDDPYAEKRRAHGLIRQWFEEKGLAW
ncbi:MAG: SDR family oxidoreductase [Armatimonadetes bacterium]|nr:SDR family oxidoreductase [Armatimonadota bacterium]